MSVYLGYLHPNEVAASFHVSLNELILYDAQGPHLLEEWGRIRSSATDIPASRNELARRFLDSECDWLFIVDADMGFQPDTLQRLMEVASAEERPIVGGLCFAYRDQGTDGLNGLRAAPLPTIFDYIEHDDGNWRFTGRAHYPVNTVTRCAATGAAMILIHRTVFEAIRSDEGDVWFDRVPGPDGLLGEDISFCLRAGALDYPIYVHTGVRTNHLKNLWVSDADFWTAIYAPAATERVDVIVPTVAARSANIPALAASLKATTGLAELILVVDDEDHATELKEYGRTVIQPGRFPVKVNAGYRESDAPWIMMVGDDCRFRPGWWDHASWIAGKYAGKVVATNDLANPRVIRGEHATHPVISRDYIETEGASWDGPGVVCHEGYKHWFCDDEISWKAKKAGVFQAALGSVVEHFHPLVGKSEMDDVYKWNDEYAERDQKLFQKRFKANM